MEDRQLRDIEEIKNLKGRYLRLQDQRKWDEWGQVFAEDATIDCRFVDREPIHWEGRASIVAGNRELNAGIRGIHHGHTPEIEVTSETTATGIWALMDVYFVPERVESFGWYEDTYVKRDGRWWIHSVTLSLE